MAKTVVLLTASWCPRCPVARRLWEGLRDRYAFELQQFDIDSPEGQAMATRHRVLSVPSVIAGGQLWTEDFDEARALEMLQNTGEEHQSADCA